VTAADPARIREIREWAAPEWRCGPRIAMVRDLLALLDAERARADKLADALAAYEDARRNIVPSLIAVRGHLDEPYPDDERWTPWTRFIERCLIGLDSARAETKIALAEHRAAREAAE
jgi:hypothetical protein